MAKDESTDVRGEAEERLINEEYKDWRRNVPFLYDTVITHALDWPSLTVEWLPGKEEPPGTDFAIHKLILGTHTSDGEPNHLLLAEVRLRLDETDEDVRDNRSQFGYKGGKVQIIQQISHDGEINRARHMPQNPYIIATKTVSSAIYIFDYSKHPPKPNSNGTCNPDLKLTGHTAEGYALSWSHSKHGHLLSGSDDAQICLWDINSASNDKTPNAKQIFKTDGNVVEDIAWHYNYEHLFGSVGDSRYLHLWDLRMPSPLKPCHKVTAHQGEVNSVSFSPINEYIGATASTDKTVKLFDLRKLSIPMHTLIGHKSEVTQVGWHPKNETVLASSCLGSRMIIWDLSRIGQEQNPKDDVEGPPELLFIHGGHTSRIGDFSWNPNTDWVVASVAEDNIVQVWEMAESIYDDDEDDDRSCN
ncbi:WD-40 repeat-containing protein MSI1-like [Andrographis paniculata]|uniref:WD-40 repeat-containing protein MSI1-like n=1 Tax=Andrographis paniculata TaxID=175694 RepID=UPI0021E865B7|nr:WD-40 repeat-containing protein MSI1-like [Andrographis paniculata]